MGKGVTPLLLDIYQIRGVAGSNIYLIREGEGFGLVDAGWPLDRRAIIRGLESLGSGLPDLNTAVVTHYHGDHMGTLRGLKRATELHCSIGAHDAAFARGDRPYERFQIDLARRIFYTSLWPLFRYRPFDVDRELHAGDTVGLLGGLEVIHTPGHSVGSICLYSRPRRLLFSGDTIRNEKGVLQGPPPQFTPDREAAARSLAKLADLDFDILLPGHGLPVMRRAGDRLRELLIEGKIWPIGDGMEQRHQHGG
ncbi:MAG: MBL fold metallo-hydrolase [Candidatus Geothermincolia bacterium]